MILLVELNRLPKNFKAFSPKKQLKLCFDLKEPIHIIPVEDLSVFEKERIDSK